MTRDELRTAMEAYVAERTGFTKGENIGLEVALDIVDRVVFGINHYGRPVQRFNGLQALQEGYSELLDAPIYLKQKILEDEALNAKKTGLPG